MPFNVLIVDDSFAMRSIIKKVLLMSGFAVDQCFAASDGRDGLAVLDKERVDVVLSDINMPEMSGLEMLKRMKENLAHQNIPVVLVSTDGSNDRVSEALRHGAKGFILKPFLPEDLRRALSGVLGVKDDGRHAGDQKDSHELDF